MDLVGVIPALAASGRHLFATRHVIAHGLRDGGDFGDVEGRNAQLLDRYTLEDVALDPRGLKRLFG